MLLWGYTSQAPLRGACWCSAATSLAVGGCLYMGGCCLLITADDLSPKSRFVTPAAGVPAFVTTTDRAIAAILREDREWVADVLAAGSLPDPRPGRYCRLWVGRVFQDGRPMVLVPYEGAFVQVTAVRLAYAFHRGVEHLPPSKLGTNPNSVVIGRVCRHHSCVADWHLVRVRKQQIREPAFWPVGCVLPDDPRFDGERVRRRCGGCEGCSPGGEAVPG